MGQSRTLYQEDKKTLMRTVIGWQRPCSKDGQRWWRQSGKLGSRGRGDGEPEEQTPPSGGCAADAPLLFGPAAGMPTLLQRAWPFWPSAGGPPPREWLEQAMEPAGDLVKMRQLAARPAGPGRTEDQSAEKTQTLPVLAIRGPDKMNIL